MSIVTKESTESLSKMNLVVNKKSPDDLCEKFVSIEETCVRHFDSESKKQRMEWWHKVISRKFYVGSSADKILS